MKRRKLGSSAIEVSEIGFGTWGIGGTEKGAVAYGPTDDKTSLEALRAAYDLGVNFYDTADLYGYGHSEELLGRAFDGVRGEVVIASKVGFVSFDGTQNFSVPHIQRSLEASLKRLRTDYIDLYQLHGPPLELLARDEEILTVLRDAMETGKIRARGLAVRSPEEGLEALERFEFEALQVNFNLTDQRALTSGLLDTCLQKGVGVIVRTPLCFGFLTGEYSSRDSFEDGDHRSAWWTPDQVDRWASAYNLFAKAVSEHQEQTNAQIALRFCLSYPAVSTTIPGMLTVAQVVENARSSDLGRFDPVELKSFNEIYEKHLFFVESR